MDNKEIKKRMSKEDRRKQILESALNVFIEKGYNGATTQEIANAADISEVTLFRHFSSKQEIFMEGIEPIIVNTLKSSIIASKELSPIEQFKYILIERVKLISKNHGVIKLILMESDVSDGLINLNYIDKVKSILKTMILDMGFDMKDEELTLRLLMGGILSFLYMPEVKEENIEKFVEQIIPCIISSFKN
jgi:AcrR family transcriptional regulator